LTFPLSSVLLTALFSDRQGRSSPFPFLYKSPPSPKVMALGVNGADAIVPLRAATPNLSQSFLPLARRAGFFPPNKLLLLMSSPFPIDRRSSLVPCRRPGPVLNPQRQPYPPNSSPLFLPFTQGMCFSRRAFLLDLLPCDREIAPPPFLLWTYPLE